MTETEVTTEITTRTCFVCHVEKPLEEFHKNKNKPLGREYMCRTCRRDCDRAQNQRPERIEKMEQYRQAESTMERNRERSKQHYIDNPEANRARAMIAGLIRAGLIERFPCQVCGKEPTDGHHPDYSKPLEVIWLCRSHHWMIERIIKGSDETMPLLFVCSYAYIMN